MEKIIYKSPELFTELMVDIYQDTPASSIVVGDYFTINEILHELISEYGFELFECILINPEVNDYQDEFALILDEDGDIFVYPAKDEKEYFNITNEDDILYVFEDVNSKFMEYNKNCTAFEVDCEEECDGDCENCHRYDDDTDLSYDEDGELHGFTRSKSTENGYYSESFYSTDPKVVEFQLNKKNF